MTSDLDHELRTAFDEASDFVQPPPCLTDRVRHAARRRRRRLTAGLAAASAVALIAAGGGFLATHGLHRSALHHGHRLKDRFPLTFPDDYTALQLATAGPYLYALIGPADGGVTLAAYNRVTGQLIHQISVPGAGGSAIAVGPGGLVWLSFAASNSAGPSGTWLLSADLRLHSSGPGGGANVLLPVSRTAALVPDQHGLFIVRLPLPGQPGRGTGHLERSGSLGPPLNTAPGVSAAALDGRIVVQVTNGYGFDRHLVVAGQPHITFGGRASEQAGYVVSAANSLWVQTDVLHGQYATGDGQLVRLNSRLQPTTPEPVLDSPILARTVQVWASAGTVWAATSARGHSLVCFTAGSKIGPIMTLPLKGEVSALAAAGDTVYVSPSPYSYLNGSATGVMSYRIPAACR